MAVRKHKAVELGLVAPVTFPTVNQGQPNGGQVQQPAAGADPGTPAPAPAPRVEQPTDLQTLLEIQRMGAALAQAKVAQVDALIETMNADAWKYVPTAYLLGKEKAAELGHPMETSVEQDEQAIQRMLVENKAYLQGLRADMLAEMTTKQSIAEVEQVFEQFTSRAESYGNWLWQAYQTGYRDNLAPEEQLEYFGPADAHSCATCLDRVEKSPYPASRAPKPGVGCECRGNCRHDLVPAGAIPWM